MIHMSHLQGPAEGEDSARCCLDVAHNGHSMCFPIQGVAQNGGENYHDETIGDISHAGVARLELALELSVQGQLINKTLGQISRSRTYLQVMTMAKLLAAMAAVKT